MKDPAELAFQELYNSIEAPDISECDVKGFIEHCETVYKMSTPVFVKWFIDNNYEGNPEMQLWWLFAKNTSEGFEVSS